MVKEQKYIVAESLKDAIRAAVASEHDFRFIAGGTDVMVNRYQGNDNTTCLIDLTKIDSLKGIAKIGDYLRIGALEILEDLQFSDILRKEYPVIIEAALSVGSPLIRKTATIGGNILCENRCLFFNQSEWWRESIGYCLKCDGDICIATGGKNACFSELVSDTAPALIALNAEIRYMDKDDTHQVKLEDIYTGDGVLPRNLPSTAIVMDILIPLNQQIETVFFKLRERKSMDFTSLTSAVSKTAEGKLRIVLAGVDPKPVVIEGNIHDDWEDLIKKAYKASRSVDNDTYSRKYRKEMIKVFISRSLNDLNN